MKLAPFIALVSAVLLVALNVEAQVSHGAELLRLAQKNFKSISPAEKVLFSEAADSGGMYVSEPEPQWQNWFSDNLNALRTGIRSDRLAWLCSDPSASALVNPNGIKLTGFLLVGDFHLDNARVPFPIWFTNCVFSGDITLNGSKFTGLAFDHVRFKSLFAPRLEVEDQFHLDNGSQSDGCINLSGSRFGDDFICDGSFANPNSIALLLARTQIGGSLIINRDFTTDGKVVLVNALVGGDLSICGTTIKSFASISNASSTAFALEANGMNVGGAVYISDSQIRGGASFSEAHVSRAFIIRDATFTNSEAPALSLAGSHIDGFCTLSPNLQLDGGAELQYASILGFLDLSNVHISREAQLTNSSEPYSALEAACLKAREGIRLDDAVIYGGVDLRGTVIGRDLSCVGASIIHSNHVALALDSARIGGGLNLTGGFLSRGQVEMYGACIDNSLSCWDCSIYLNSSNKDNQGTFAIDASYATIGKDIDIGADFNTDGDVGLDNATCRNFYYNNMEKPSTNRTLHITAEGANIRDKVSLNVANANTRFNFTDASIEKTLDVYCDPISARPTTNYMLFLASAKIWTLCDSETSWPVTGNLILNNCEYENIGGGATTDSAKRIKWLHLQPRESFFPQPYEHLAKVLQNMGHDHDAALILVAKNIDYAKHSDFSGIRGLPSFIWYHFVGKLDGYGHLPGLAFEISVIWIFIGMCVFCCGCRLKGIHSRNGHLPRNFVRLVGSGFAYSIETFVPLLKLEAVERWRPTSPQYLSYYFVHRLAGWMLTTLWFTGFTGLLKT